MPTRALNQKLNEIVLNSILRCSIHHPLCSLPSLLVDNGADDIYWMESRPAGRQVRRGKVSASRMSCPTFRIVSANGWRANSCRIFTFMAALICDVGKYVPILFCRGRPGGAFVRCVPCPWRGPRWFQSACSIFSIALLDLSALLPKNTPRRMPVKSSARKKSSRANQRDLDTKIEFLEGLLRRDPTYVDALQLLGDHYTQRGRYMDGLKVDERLARLEPRQRPRILQSCLQLLPHRPV